MGSLPCWVWLQRSQSRPLASVLGYCRWWQESCTKQSAKHCYLNLPAEERILKIKVPHAAVSEILSQCSCGHGGVEFELWILSFAGQVWGWFFCLHFITSWELPASSDRWWHGGSDSMGPSSMFGLGQIWATWKAHRDLPKRAVFPVVSVQGFGFEVFLAWILNLWCPFLFCVNALALIAISGGMSVDMEPQTLIDSSHVCHTHTHTHARKRGKPENVCACFCSLEPSLLQTDVWYFWRCHSL